MLVGLEMYLAKRIHGKGMEVMENKIKLISDSALTLNGWKQNLCATICRTTFHRLRISWDNKK